MHIILAFAVAFTVLVVWSQSYRKGALGSQESPSENGSPLLRLLEVLSNAAEPLERIKAANGLADRPGKRTLAILERLASDPDESVRRAAAQATRRLAEQSTTFTAPAAAPDPAPQMPSLPEPEKAAAFAAGKSS